MKDTIATVIVDLKRSEEEIMKSFQKDGRYGINKAIKEGLLIGMPHTSDDEDWINYYTIYKQSMDAVGVEPMTLEKLKKESCVLFSCFKDNKMIAGATLKMPKDVFAYGDVPTLGTNASLEEYRNLQPNNLLYWECIKWAKEKGYDVLDLGGWQMNARDNMSGINAFKERWGKVVYYKKDFPFYRAIGRKLIRNSSLMWKLNNLIKGRKVAKSKIPTEWHWSWFYD